MVKHWIALISVIFALFACSTIAVKHIIEKPAFLTPCDWNSADFNSCMVKNYQNMFVGWKDGVPGIKSVGSLDPLEIKRVKVSQDDSNLISINADLTNIFIHGSSHIEVKSANVKRDHYEIKVYFPKLRFDLDYKLDGRVLNLPVTGEGNGYFILEKSSMTITGDIKPSESDGLKFVDIITLKVSIDDIQNFHIQLDNLFNGQKELGDAANALFNGNWRDLIHVLQPVLEQTVETVMKDRFTKIFKHLPAEYIFTEY